MHVDVCRTLTGLMSTVVSVASLVSLLVRLASALEASVEVLSCSTVACGVSRDLGCFLAGGTWLFASPKWGCTTGQS